MNNNDIIHSLRTMVFRLKKPQMKLLFLDNARKCLEGKMYTHSRYMYFHFAIRDLCLYKLQKTYKKPSKAFLVVDHVNKLVEKVNLSRLMSSCAVKNYFPVKSEHYASPSVSYSYSNNIRSSIDNYKATLMDTNHGNVSCHCHDYPSKYKNHHYGHIVTGDIDIIDNLELRNLLKKGLGYHDQQPCNKEEAMNAVKVAVDTYIGKVSPKLSVSISAFTAWKTKLMEKADNKINNMKSHKFNNILTKNTVKAELSKLQDHFVFVPVDKTSKNVSLVCKMFYQDIVTEEIVNSSTFEKVSDNPDDFMQVLVRKFGSNNPNSLPYLYATTKMHKNPIKFRYITAARETFFSDKSIAVSKCLKLLMKTSQTSIQYKIKGIKNSNFVIDSRDKVISFMNNSNRVTEKRQVSTWDFSTLYTKIPLDKLKDKVAEFVRKMYDIILKSKKSNFITCSPKSNTAYFSKSKSKINASFTTEELIKEINCIIDLLYTEVRFITKRLEYRWGKIALLF